MANRDMQNKSQTGKNTTSTGKDFEKKTSTGKTEEDWSSPKSSNKPSSSTNKSGDMKR